MKLYREVPITERSPDKEGRYIVSNGSTWFEVRYSDHFSFHEEFTDCSGVVAWLEAVEVPTDDKIADQAEDYADGWGDLNDETSFKAGVNWLKERLGL